MKKKFYNERNGGDVMILTTIFFLVIGFIILSGLSFTVFKDVRNMQYQVAGRVSYYVSEGGMEDAIYKLKNAITVSTSSTPIDSNFAYITLGNNGDGTNVLSSLSSTSDFYKQIRVNLTLATSISFHYGVQSGNGGFTLGNSSNIIGNVYTEGTISGSSLNSIGGDITTTGSGGQVYGVHATGTVYSHSIGLGGSATTIDRDAYYQSIANTTVTGTGHPGNPDSATTTLPIPDSVISEWENEAASGTTLVSSWCDTYSGGVCTITTDRTIGTTTVPFDLVVKGVTNGVTLTISGPLWVKGNLTIQNKGIVRMSSSLGGQNVPIIADNPTSTTSSGLIITQQGSAFYGSGSTGSYVFMISQNRSAEAGGANTAISMQQGSSALVVYASHGLISLSQSTNVLDAVGYKISLINNASVTYDPGLYNVSFTSGSASDFSIINWGEL